MPTRVMTRSVHTNAVMGKGCKYWDKMRYEWKRNTLRAYI